MKEILTIAGVVLICFAVAVCCEREDWREEVRQQFVYDHPIPRKCDLCGMNHEGECAE